MSIDETPEDLDARLSWWRVALMSIPTLITAGIWVLPIWLIWLWLDLAIIENLGLLLLAHGAVALLLVGQYLAGTAATIHETHAVSLDENSQLRQSCDVLAERMGVAPPRLMVGNFGGVANAVAVGRRGNGTVILSETLLEVAAPDEINAIMAHELSHLRTRDTMLLLLGDTAEYFVARLQTAVYGPGLIRRVLTSSVSILLAIVRVLILLPIRLIGRQREYAADKHGGRATHPHALAKALATIHDHNTQRVPKEIAANLHGSQIVDQVGTHPPMEKRIKRLEAQAERRHQRETNPQPK